MKVVFRVDASLQIGTGHVIRCLTLAEELKRNGANVEFICRKHEGNLIEKIRSNGFNVFELKLPEANKFDNKLFHSHWLGVTQQQDTKDCVSVLQLAKVDWLIVDHYGIDKDWQRGLQAYYDKLMVVDDLADRKHNCDILLDQTFGRQQQDYKELVPKSCELLLGSQYALLRPEFAEWRQYSIERRKYPVFKELLINMGGIDADNVTGQVLKELEACNLPNDINITIVMGGLAPHLENIKTRVETLSYRAEVKVDVDNMAEIMSKADIAIGAAGGTTWERCCLGLPTIQIIIAKNQEFSAVILEKNNIVKLLTKVRGLTNLLNSPTEWMGAVGNSATQICQGIGVYKVLSQLRKLI
jgi:UDP-2,4-diacetamido-2,4,6-trideoxy-beta-L-altropyranose hydrolase